jgi:hypothetical protein
MSLGNKGVLKFIKNNAVCVEVGVWKGDLSRHIAQLPISELHLIDPWQAINDVEGRLHNTEQEKLDRIYRIVKRRFSFDKKVKLIRKFSAKAMLDFEDGSIDWVYIDGNHSYEFVKEDLNGWWPKLKSGGYLCGDDYIEGKYQVEELQFGIVKAVDEFKEERVTEINHSEIIKDQFVLQKK